MSYREESVLPHRELFSTFMGTLPVSIGHRLNQGHNIWG
jgi:hypothetical protein